MLILRPFDSSLSPFALMYSLTNFVTSDRDAVAPGGGDYFLVFFFFFASSFSTCSRRRSRLEPQKDPRCEAARRRRAAPA